MLPCSVHSPRNYRRPPFLLQGAYNGSADATDVKGAQLACVAFQTKL